MQIYDGGSAILHIPKWFLFSLLILANLVWSASFPATSLATQDVSPILLVMTRLTIGGFLLSPFIFIHARRGELRIRGVWRSAVLGLLGFTVPVTLESAGIHSASAALGAISIALEPLLTLVVFAVILRSRLHYRQTIAMFVAAIGAWTVAGAPRPGFVGDVRGDLYLLAAVCCYAFYNALSARMTEDVPATAATSVMLLAGAVGCVPIFFVTGHHVPSHLSFAAFWSILYLSVLATAGAYLVWLVVLQDHDVSSAAISLYLQPIFGVLLSILIVHARPAWYFYVGTGLILCALYLGRRPSSNESPAEKPHVV